MVDVKELMRPEKHRYIAIKINKHEEIYEVTASEQHHLLDAFKLYKRFSDPLKEHIWSVYSRKRTSWESKNGKGNGNKLPRALRNYLNQITGFPT